MYSSTFNSLVVAKSYMCSVIMEGCVVAHHVRSSSTKNASLKRIEGEHFKFDTLYFLRRIIRRLEYINPKVFCVCLVSILLFKQSQVGLFSLDLHNIIPDSFRKVFLRPTKQTTHCDIQQTSPGLSCIKHKVSSVLSYRLFSTTLFESGGYLNILTNFKNCLVLWAKHC